MSIRRSICLCVVPALLVLSGCGSDSSQEGESFDESGTDAGVDTSPPSDVPSTDTRNTTPPDTVADSRDDNTEEDASRRNDGDSGDTTSPDDTSTSKDTRYPVDTSLPPDTTDTSSPPDVSDATDTSADTTTDASDTSDTVADASDTSDATMDTQPPQDARPSQFGPGSFVTDLTVDQNSAIGNLFGLASSFGGGTDFNQLIQQQIQSGQLIYLLEYDQWTKLKNDPSLTLYVHPGEDANPANGFQPNLNGNGTFNIDPASYGPSGQPQATLPNASITSGAQSPNLRAQGGTVQIAIPVGSGTSYQLRIQDAVLKADLIIPPNKTKPGEGVGLKNGTLSGEVPKEDVVQVVNQIIGGQCGCQNPYLVLQNPQAQDPETYKCNAQSNCSGSSLICQQCSLVLRQLRGLADIDRDNDGTNDAYSFKADFKAVVGEIVGVASP